MKLFFSLIATILLFAFCGYALDPTIVQKINNLFPPSNKPIRILDLWPKDFLAGLAIEPALPKNFVLKTIKDSGEEYFVWGPKEVLDAFDPQDLTTLTQPILIFRMSLDTAQTGPKSFSGEEELEKTFIDSRFKHFSHKTTMWGNYPVLSITCDCNSKALACAWIGLNYNSYVLFARLAYPGKQEGPTTQDLQLWNTFLQNTTTLSELDTLRVHGIDLHDGYTCEKVGYATLTCIAERRKKDNLTQIFIIPTSDNTNFKIKDISQGLSGTSWKRGEELVKIPGTLFQQYKEGGTLEAETVISIFIKNVNDFSLDNSIFQNEPNVLCVKKELSPL